MTGDCTQLFTHWVEDCDCVTAGEVLAFANYVNWTVSKTIATLREAGIDVIPEHHIPGMR